jgi:hypothetical protein
LVGIPNAAASGRTPWDAAFGRDPSAGRDPTLRHNA